MPAKQTKKAATASKKGPAPAIPTVKVDKELKASWDAALARLRRARAQEAVQWDDAYEAIAEIIDEDHPLYLAGGFATARAFLAVEMPGQDERNVRRMARVAVFFTPEDEAAHGVSKLDALLDYFQAAGGGPLTRLKINLARQKIPVKQGKSIKQVPFAEVTVVQLRAATRAASAGTGSVATTLPAPVKALKTLLARADLGAISVFWRGGTLTLGGIALPALKKLGKVLTSAKLPAT